MDNWLNDYLSPVDFSLFGSAGRSRNNFSLAALLAKNSEKLPVGKAKIVLVGVGEDRNAVVRGSAAAPAAVREHLYRLNRIDARLKMLDLGDIRVGQTPADTYFALEDVCCELTAKGITVVVIGGSQDLTFGIAKAFQDKTFSLVNIDPFPDYRKGDRVMNSENYLSFIFGRHRGHLSHVTLGCQNYYTDSVELSHLYASGAEAIRLGMLRYDIAEVEPYMREADVVSFDLGAVRQTGASGRYIVSPNGLHGEEACQIAHYAGIGDKVKVAGFFNLIPRAEGTDMNAALTAQVVWHFIEGFYCRYVEEPARHPAGFSEFIVELHDMPRPLTFLRSRNTGRWWMKIFNEYNDCHEMIACSEQDYDQASHDEVPDRWWRAMRRFSDDNTTP